MTTATIELDGAWNTVGDAMALRSNERGVAVLGASCSYIDIRTAPGGIVEFSCERGAWVGFSTDLLDATAPLVPFLYALFLAPKL